MARSAVIPRTISCRPVGPSRLGSGRNEGTSIADWRDLEPPSKPNEQMLPPSSHSLSTSDEPQEVREKIISFDRNLIEAVIIVVLVALVFMEWRSALLVAVSIPRDGRLHAGLVPMVGIDSSRFRSRP